MNFTGTWHVVSSPDFDDAYLRMETEPYVKLHQTGDRVDGEYHIGLQRGDLDGQLQGPDQIFFSFEGMDEMDQAHGRGAARLEENRLLFTLSYHMGDEFTFYCEREGQGKSSGRSGTKRGKTPR